jgi:hypothetical protein
MCSRQSAPGGVMMTDQIENIILEHLKRFQSGQDRIERRLELA